MMFAEWPGVILVITSAELNDQQCEDEANPTHPVIKLPLDSCPTRLSVLIDRHNLIKVSANEMLRIVLF